MLKRVARANVSECVSLCGGRRCTTGPARMARETAATAASAVAASQQPRQHYSGNGAERRTQTDGRRQARRLTDKQTDTL